MSQPEDWVLLPRLPSAPRSAVWRLGVAPLSDGLVALPERGAVTAEAAACGSAETGRRRAVARLRRELHRIAGRDYFPAPQRGTARAAVEDLAAASQAGARA